MAPPFPTGTEREGALTLAFDTFLEPSASARFLRNASVGVVVRNLGDTDASRPDGRVTRPRKLSRSQALLR